MFTRIVERGRDGSSGESRVGSECWVHVWLVQYLVRHWVVALWLLFSMDGLRDAYLDFSPCGDSEDQYSNVQMHMRKGVRG